MKDDVLCYTFQPLDPVQKSRLEQVNSFCESHPDMQTINTDKRGFYYINAPFFYCDVPKLGSTFLKAFLPKAFGCDGVYKSRIPSLYLSKHVFSFLNVGDPYSRLFSAYKDKLYTPDVKFWNKIGDDIVKTIRINTSESYSGFDVTFRETVQYVVELHESGNALNQHLEPIHKICNPCTTRFDFISKTSTMSDDLVHMFEVLKNTSIVGDGVNVFNIEGAIKYNERLIVGKVGRLFDAIKTYPDISAYQLFLRLWATFQIGGNILNRYEMPFPESTVSTVSPRQYEQALIDAVNKSKDYRDELRSQRQEALIQAYRSVPLKLMLRLREFVMTDCLLFSYDDKPAFLFDRDTLNNSISHKYMKGI